MSTAFMKIETITLGLTYFHIFMGQLVRFLEKMFGKLVRYIFRPVVKIDHKQEKTTLIEKLPFWCVLISERCLYSILEEQIAARNSKSYVVGF